MSDSDSDNNTNSRSSTPEYKKYKRGESSTAKKHRAQKYRKNWESLQEFKGWLCEAKDTDKAYCRCCNTVLNSEITVLKNHAKSKRHMTKVRAIPSTTVTDIFKKAEDPRENQVKYAEIKLLGYFTEHNISFNCLDHLTPVLRDCFPDSKIAKEIKLHRTKGTQIVKNVIGSYGEEEINRILRLEKFSLIIDESTDIASVKTLCICVRFFHEQSGNIITTFWNLVQVFSGDKPDIANEGATAQRLFTEIENAFISKNIPLSNIIGFASDGCNTMFGIHNSVACRLIDALPGVIVQKCICHSLHLCASEACKCLPRRCEDLARNIYNFFKNSAKRKAMFQEFQVFCEVDPHQILRPAQTRWLSLLSVVKRIIEQFEPLRLFFTSNYIEHKVLSSEEIYNDLNDRGIKLFYFFLEWVLPKFVELNKFFQNDRVVITQVHDEMCSTFKDLLFAYMEPNYVRQTELSGIDPSNSAKFININNIYLGIRVMQEVNELNNKQDFYCRCRNFLITACNEIKKRYDFSDPILSEIKVLNKSNIKSCSSLLSLMLKLPRIVDPKDTEKLQKIDDQWRKLQNFENPLPECESLDEFYYKLGKIVDFQGNVLFDNLSQFALCVLSLPHSSASCERVFSKVNLVKTKSRNKLVTSTLNGIMHCAQTVKIAGNCGEFKPNSKMIKSMTSANLYSKKQEKDVENQDTEEVVEVSFGNDE